MIVEQTEIGGDQPLPTCIANIALDFIGVEIIVACPLIIAHLVQNCPQVVEHKPGSGSGTQVVIARQHLFV